MFDAKQFLNQTVSAPMSTSMKPAPEGEWKMMIATDIPIEEWFGEATFKDRSGVEKTSPTVKIPFEIIDDTARGLAKREKIIVYYDAFLDLEPDGTLSTADDKNVKIGALREALHQNHERDWTFHRLWGAGPFVGKVIHQSSKQNPEDKYGKVSKVRRIS